jgi:para-aminobenzoate synthetase/4-amino-4-deoxychorismate lyase
LHSEKDRAENLMITDMMRNDIGRIARSGSVEVPRLFALEKHPTLWQMTSTVRARSDASPAEILGALFPCASITGAPKLRTMGIIAALEDSPRGIYTGAIGTIAPDGRARFSVAIRTACVPRSTGEAEYGVGGGIVWDSVPERELEESRLKGAVLSEPVPEFELLETIRWQAEDGFWLIHEHLERLAASAEYFAIPFDRETLRSALEDAVAGAQHDDARVRVRLSPDGAVHTEVSPYEETAAPWRLRPAADSIDPANRFLYHKTTHRAPYLQARESARDCEDVLLWNETGYVTETTVANVVARIDAELVTPPVSCGLLAGTYRARLLREGTIVERPIHLSELDAASELYLINSLRGWIPARMAD